MSKVPAGELPVSVRSPFDKLWGRHVVEEHVDGASLMYVDRREVAKIHAYEQRRLAQEPWLFPADRHAGPDFQHGAAAHYE